MSDIELRRAAVFDAAAERIGPEAANEWMGEVRNGMSVDEIVENDYPRALRMAEELSRPSRVKRLIKWFFTPLPSPTCPRCGSDVDADYPTGSVCPECEHF